MVSQARDTKQREQVLGAVSDRLRSGERVIAVLPFASTPKRPKRPQGKVRVGIYQTSRRYRPLVVTSDRLFVINTSRTPYPRGVLAEFPIADVDFVDLVPAGLSQGRLLLALPDNGTVPFDLGRYDIAELPELRAALERS